MKFQIWSDHVYLERLYVDDLRAALGPQIRIRGKDVLGSLQDVCDEVINVIQDFHPSHQNMKNISAPECFLFFRPPPQVAKMSVTKLASKCHKL